MARKCRPWRRRRWYWKLRILCHCYRVNISPIPCFFRSWESRQRLEARSMASACVIQSRSPQRAWRGKGALSVSSWWSLAAPARAPSAARLTGSDRRRCGHLSLWLPAALNRRTRNPTCSPVEFPGFSGDAVSAWLNRWRANKIQNPR